MLNVAKQCTQQGLDSLARVTQLCPHMQSAHSTSRSTKNEQSRRNSEVVNNSFPELDQSDPLHDRFSAHTYCLEVVLVHDNISEWGAIL